MSRQPRLDESRAPLRLAELDPAYPEDGPRLRVDLEGFEGPLDLLLELARAEKLDLKSISILALAEQYLAFIAAAQQLRLALAADYLVMAAWLTYLKSRLLLPQREEAPGPATEELVEDLAERLRRLEKIRRMGAWLGERLAEAGNAFPRGGEERKAQGARPVWSVNLHDLVAAFAQSRSERIVSRYRLSARECLSIPEARARLEALIGGVAQWCPLDLLLAAIAAPGLERRTLLASGFAASLELARDGRLELRQETAFAPLFLRQRTKAKENIA